MCLRCEKQGYTVQSSNSLFAANVNILHSQTRALPFFFKVLILKHLAPNQSIMYNENENGRLRAESDDEHCVPVGVEAEFVLDRFLIGIHDQLIPAKCTNHDQQA